MSTVPCGPLLKGDFFLYIYFSVLPKFFLTCTYHFDNQEKLKRKRRKKENSINLRDWRERTEKDTPLQCGLRNQNYNPQGRMTDIEILL